MIFSSITITALAFVISLVLNRMMLALGPRLGLMDLPGERRIHSTPIPRAGGIAIWFSFLAVVAGGLASGWLKSSGQLSWSWLSAFFLGSLVLMVAGFLDDRSGLRPVVKLAAHALAPTVFFLVNPISTGLFPVHWHWIFDYLTFLIWVVALINAFNLIDGLDGLCGGLAAVASVGLAMLALMNGRMASALLLFAMGGAILGFLKYNFNPARIFLGDAGSMLMGFFLATAATEAAGRRAVVGMILLPIAVAGVPLLDVLLAIWRRGARRIVKKLHGEEVVGGIFDADSDHLHHRLLASSGSPRKVAMVMQGMAILLALLAFLPLIFGDKIYGLSLVGLMIVGMLGVRNLARVEIEHTGRVIHMAIKLPGHRRRVAAALFCYDILVFALAGIAAMIAETNMLQRGEDVEVMIRFVGVFVIFGSISTLLARVHRRLWVRATMRDLVSLQFWLLVASVASFTAFSLAYETLEWSALRLTVMSFVFACIGVCLPRVFLDLFRDLGLDASYRNSKAAKDHGYGPVVALGAGDFGALFISHLKSSDTHIYPGLRVLGFLDESEVLHGRRFRSFRILGGLSAIPQLAEEGLRGIILTIKNPRKELMDQLESLAAAHHLKIYHWNVMLEERTDRRCMEVSDPPLDERGIRSAAEQASPDGDVGNGGLVG
jgi:UDP-N-acetylmuramyl pentapeptide phosphotransferase/UDP-N-acetylglucosamine-1-phosphate transferase